MSRRFYQSFTPLKRAMEAIFSSVSSLVQVVIDLGLSELDATCCPYNIENGGLYFVLGSHKRAFLEGGHFEHLLPPSSALASTLVCVGLRVKLDDLASHLCRAAAKNAYSHSPIALSFLDVLVVGGSLEQRTRVLTHLRDNGLRAASSLHALSTGLVTTLTQGGNGGNDEGGDVLDYFKEFGVKHVIECSGQDPTSIYTVLPSGKEVSSLDRLLAALDYAGGGAGAGASANSRERALDDDNQQTGASSSSTFVEASVSTAGSVNPTTAPSTVSVVALGLEYGGGGGEVEKKKQKDAFSRYEKKLVKRVEAFFAITKSAVSCRVEKSGGGAGATSESTFVLCLPQEVPLSLIYSFVAVYTCDATKDKREIAAFLEDKEQKKILRELLRELAVRSSAADKHGYLFAMHEERFISITVPGRGGK